MLTLHARKSGSKWTCDGFRDAVAGLADGDYVISVAPKKAKRSVQANRRYWSLLTIAARELGYDDIEELHEGIAMKLLPLPTLADGVPRRRRTPKLNTKEFAEYTDAVERFLMMDLGIDLSGWETEAA